MLAEIYIEALLIDEELADQIWEVWDAGIITDELAAWAWLRNGGEGGWPLRGAEGDCVAARLEQGSHPPPHSARKK